MQNTESKFPIETIYAGMTIFLLIQNWGSSTTIRAIGYKMDMTKRDKIDTDSDTPSFLSAMFMQQYFH